MASQRLKNYLDNHNVYYEVISHPIAFSALQLCEVSHIPSKKMAKTVICKTTNDLFMVVISAHDQVNLEELKKLIGTPVVLATEEEFSGAFPDCEVGAMPPFGNLYDMDVYVSEDLVHGSEIAFNAGNHSELYKMQYKDYEKLVHPKIIHTQH
ncbi:MAG TPA: YbaK/EbsC family protein [Gammaproteobacteria bacterium]|nr:YbaK/EbsC family protein [Gammaproteobacteria bacterium]